jgi:hypothetical protein
MKKLIPALCMLLVAAALLGTSTFAWFSMSTKVEATNMAVKATVTKNLLISKTSSTAGYGAGVDMAINATGLVPVSTIGGDTETPAFYKLKTAGTKMSQGSYAYGDDTTMEAATVSTHYVKTTVWLKCVGNEGGALKLAPAATDGGTKALDPALRVMIVDKTNTKTYIYSPITGAAYGTTGQAVASLSSEKPQLGAIKTAATSDTELLTTMTADQAYEFDIYVWYEGEDKSCKVANTVDMASTTLALAFTIPES